MFGLGLGKLGSVGRAIASLQSQLWPLGAASPGLWIDPSTTTASYQDSAGTTALSAIGTVLDTSNPIGLILDRKDGPTLGLELVNSAIGVAGDAYVIRGSSVAVGGGFYTLTTTSVDSVSFGVTAATTDGFIAVGGYYAMVIEVSSISSSQPLKIYPSSAQNSGIVAGEVKTISAAGTYTYYPHTQSADTLTFGLFNPSGGTAVIGDTVTMRVSIKRLPGIHLSQSTSAARPVASARSNLLTYSEALDNAAWTKGSVTVTETTAISPIGTATADRIVASGTGWAVYSTVALVSGTTYTISVYAKSATGSSQTFKLYGNNGGGGAVSGVLTATSAWQLFSFSFTAGAGTLHGLLQDGTLADLYIWGAQLNLGSTALPYQRVNTAADYDASAGPTYLQFDGVDDALSSVPFAAGTLTSSMDCLIAVRRDSAENCIILSETNAGARYIGLCLSGSGALSVDVSGAPTVFVDCTQLAGGTSVTSGTLHTALSAGDWHILEYRGLDLSTWTAIKAADYTGFALNGAIGGKGIMLFPSTTDAIRDRARTELAASVGLTL